MRHERLSYSKSNQIGEWLEIGFIDFADDAAYRWHWTVISEESTDDAFDQPLWLMNFETISEPIELAECLDCGERAFPETISVRLIASAKKVIGFPKRVATAVATRTVAFVEAILSIPSRVIKAVADLPWQQMLMVRKGFVVGVLAGVSVAGSTLWALSSLPYLPGHPPELELVHPAIVPTLRPVVPTELAWFLIQFPYITESAKITRKNGHTYVVSDSPRRKEYVVQFGQRFRRVEIYSSDDKGSSQVQLFTPGSKRTVWFRDSRVVGEANAVDANLWMWKAPLWNATHMKIYGLADLWLDAPYKRFSCAGFVHRFLADAGVHVPILDAWDMAKQPWTRVSADEMEPGDIVTIRAASASHRRFWHHQITHVGVYIGQGKMIHAATPTRRAPRAWVRISDLEDFNGRIDKILRPPELL